MKTNQTARKVRNIRYVASLVAVLFLVSAEFLMVCRLGSECGQRVSQPELPVPAMGDWFAAK